MWGNGKKQKDEIRKKKKTINDNNKELEKVEKERTKRNKNTFCISNLICHT